MPNAALVNFAGGEISQKARGRFDIQSYFSSCRKLVNFIPEVQGPATFRTGFRCVGMTRGGKKARLIPFEFSDSITYVFELTDGKIRLYKNGALVTGANPYSDILTVLSITKGTQTTITVDTTSVSNFSNGDQVRFYLSGPQLTSVGMSEIFNRDFVVSDATSNSFKIKDPISGEYIDSSSYESYISPGIEVRKIHEVDSPYTEDELDQISYVKTANTLVLTHPSHSPRALNIYAPYINYPDNFFIYVDYFLVSNNVFSNWYYTSTTKTITAISRSNNTGQIFVSGGVSDMPTGYFFVELSGVTGMTELNNRVFLASRSVITGSIYVYLIGCPLSPVSFSQFSSDASGGVVKVIGALPDNQVSEFPLSVCLYYNRLVFGGTTNRPNTLFFSAIPDVSGNTNYNNFTGGLSDDAAFFYTVSPINNRNSYIGWVYNSAKGLVIGTFSSIYLASGTDSSVITPSDIQIRPVESVGAQYGVYPSVVGSDVFFIERGGMGVRGLIYDNTIEDVRGYNAAMLSAQFFASGITRLVYQQTDPRVLWAVGGDGALYGMVLEKNEGVFAWFRSYIGIDRCVVEDAISIVDADSQEQLWLVAKKGGRYYILASTDHTEYPDLEDFYTGEANKTPDLEHFNNRLWELQGKEVYVDFAKTYRLSVGNLTIGGAAGSGVTFTSTDDVFHSGMVGAEIWKKAGPDGRGKGKAVITQVNSTTSVTCNITEDFDSTDTIPEGQWFITTNEVNGLWDLEGEKVAVQADGAVISDGGISGEYPDITVANGRITLPDDMQAAEIHIGLPYEGLLQTLNLEFGGQSGPAQDTPRHIHRIDIRFNNTLGAQYGTDIYKMEKVEYEENGAIPNRVLPVFSGVKKLYYPDNWDTDKHVVIMQRLPLPCQVQYLNLYYDMGDE